MTEINSKPHQDPIHQPRRGPTDALAAALLRIEELETKIQQTATAAGEGAGVLMQRIDGMRAQLSGHEALSGRNAGQIEAIESRESALTSQASLNAQKIAALERENVSLRDRLLKLEAKS